MGTAASRLGVDLSVQVTAESILLSFADDIAPTLPLISGDWETVHLAALHDIYRIYDAVIEFQMTTQEAIEALSEMAERKGRHGKPFMLFIYGVTCTCIGSLMFNARILDLPAIFCFGFGLGVLRVYLTPRSNHRDVLDVIMVVFTSCLARMLGTISGDEICFPAVAQAIIGILLPGYTVGEINC